MNWLRKLWYARLRRIDLKVLWPICKRKAHNLDHAKAAFATHAYNDAAWLSLGESELFKAIDRLV